jgi:hypothetical protein
VLLHDRLGEGGSLFGVLLLSRRPFTDDGSAHVRLVHLALPCVRRPSGGEIELDGNRQIYCWLGACERLFDGACGRVGATDLTRARVQPGCGLPVDPRP